MNYRRLFILIFLFLSLVAFPIASSPSSKKPVFHPLYLEDQAQLGISYASLKDKEGFLWIATDYGLKRYDGYTLKTFLQDVDDQDSLGASGLFELLVHSNGNLWVAGAVLSRYKPETQTFVNFTIDGYKTIRAIEEDTQGHLWLGGDAAGLIHFDPYEGKVLEKLFTENSDNKISDIKIAEGGQALWVAFSKGVYKLDLTTKTKEVFYLPRSSTKKRVLAIEEDAQGSLWVATNSGLYVLEASTGEFKNFAKNSHATFGLKTKQLSAVMRDSKGRMWVGTDKEGLYCYHPKTQNFTHYPSEIFSEGLLPPGNISNIYEDEKGSLWISVGPYGVYRLSSALEKFSVYRMSPNGRNSLSFDNVLGMLEDNQANIWIATDGGGLNKYNPNTGRFVHYRHDPNDNNSLSADSVLAVDQDSQGNIWIGTWGGGLNRFNPTANTFTHYTYNPNASEGRSIAGNNVFNIEVMDDGRILLGVWQNGMQIFDPVLETFEGFRFGDESDELSNINITTIKKSNDGNYWLSGYWGVEKFHPETNTFEKYQLPYVGGAINVYEDKQDTLWIATSSSLLRYRPNIKELKGYTTHDGLSDNFPLAIEEDDLGYLWVSTRNGLNKFDPQSEKFEIFSIADGLAGSQFNRASYLKSSDRKLYFGSTKGVVVFDPLSMPRNEFSPNVQFIDLELFQQRVDPNDSPWLDKHVNYLDHLILPHSQRDIAITFSALNFISPTKNIFRYRLLGLEDKWLTTNSQNRRVRYTNLKPGDYTFQIISANNDGVWNGTARELKLTILPARWQTWWAILLYIIAAILFLYFYGQWKIRQNRSREKQLRELVDEQTAQLRKANRAVLQSNSELEQRVTQRTLALSQEIEERRESEAKVTFIAYHDALTGLYNRAWLINHLDELINRNDKNKYAVFYIGGDRFRKINDRHGHAVGDLLLQAAAKRLAKAIPQESLVVRLGSDEFALVIDNFDVNTDALTIGKSICSEFKNKFLIEKLHLAFEVSVGIVIAGNNYSESSTILRDANIAMQRAKDSGRGKSRIFDDNMLQDVVHSIAIENALKVALERSEFSVVYQPIVALNPLDANITDYNKNIDCYELLLRWCHPEMGWIPPDRFISIAEHIGLIYELGLWVIKQACLQIALWTEEFGEHRVPKISVNLSPIQLGQEDLLEQIEAILQTTRVPAEKLKLEITESSLMVDTESTHKILQDVKNRGIDLAIDDFGTGYSSLSYLDRLPVKFLKIDRTFVNAMFDSENDSGNAHEIVRATINLAHSLNMQVVAEGIETEQQIDTLRSYGCDFGQGYYIGKPMPADKATEYLSVK